MLGIIKKMRFRDKMILSYLVIIVVLVMLFFVFVKQTVNNYIQNQLIYSAENSCQRTREYLEQSIMTYSGVLHMLVNDSVVEEAVNSDFDNMSYFHQYNLACRLESEFINVVDKNDVDRVRIFLPDTFEFTNMDYTGKFSDVTDTEWYKRIVDDKKALLCVREESGENGDFITIGKVISHKNNFNSHIGALKLYISEEKLQRTLEKNVISDDGLCYIVNEYGDVITCSDYTRLDKYRVPETVFQQALGTSWTNFDVKNGNAMCIVSEIEYSGWYLVNVMSDEFLRRESRRLNRNMIINMLLAIIVSYIFAYFISHSINKRIIRLNNSVIRANKGEYIPIQTSMDISDSGDEIDILSQNYNEMIIKLEKALQAQYENGKIIKSAELKILYEQINPHFLYNVLDLINWMAINNETENISKVVTMLAKYYKLSLNKGNEIISLEDELEHVRLYFEIQKIRFDNMSEINIDVPGEILGCKIIKTVFQPLLENFIKHGEPDEEKQGVFSVSAQVHDNDIVFTVSDNGKGISPEIISAVVDGTYESPGGSGFGLRSLNERIQLYYGEGYGLTFGDCSDGTTIYVKVRKTKDK